MHADGPLPVDRPARRARSCASRAATTTRRPVYDDDPVAVARRFDAAGARWIHVVDLDAARDGGNPNLGGDRGDLRERRRCACRPAAACARSPTRASGSRRACARVVIGSAAVEHPEVVDELARAASRVRSRSGSTPAGATSRSTAGPTRPASTSSTLAAPFDRCPASARSIVTDIDRDGMLAGPRPRAARARCSPRSTVPVIASGGVGSARRPARARRARGRRPAARRRDRRPRDLRGPVHRRGGDRRVLAVRVIPCLDVDAGRVVKGVQLRRASATPAIRSSSRRATTPRAPTSSCSSTSPRRATTATRWCTSSSRSPSRCSSRSPSAGDPHASKTCAGCCARAPTRCRSTPRRSTIPTSCARAADEFGAQCIVVAIDARRRNADDPGAGWEVVTHGGRTPTGLDAVEWAEQVCALGAGEILLTSMDRDGTKAGYDIELLQAVGDAVDVPIIASGGVGTLEHLYEGAADGRRDAACWRRRSSTSASTPCARRRPYLADRGLTVVRNRCSPVATCRKPDVDTDGDRKVVPRGRRAGVPSPAPSARARARHVRRRCPWPNLTTLGGGAMLPGTSARRRSLLPPISNVSSMPRTAAFDELEHAYEDGDRSAFESDLAAWHSAVEPPGVVPRSARLLGGAVLVCNRSHARSVGDAATKSADVSVTTRSVRPTKKWLAPGTTVDVRRGPCRDVAAAIVRRARGTRRARRARACFGRASVATASRTVGRKRSGGAIATQPAMRGSSMPSAMSAPNDQPTSASGTPRDRARRSVVERGDDVERFVAALGVRALAALDAAEVEAQARDARPRAARRTARRSRCCAWCRRTADADGTARRRRASRRRRPRPLGLEREAVGGASASRASSAHCGDADRVADEGEHDRLVAPGVVAARRAAVAGAHLGAQQDRLVRGREWRAASRPTSPAPSTARAGR